MSAIETSGFKTGYTKKSIMKIRKPSLHLLLVFALLAAFGVPVLSAQEKGQSPPKWLQDHMIYMTSGTGVWVADNSSYKSAVEPYDQYVAEWKWGIGKNSIQGRLFARAEGTETSDFWEYRLFWHPKERRAVIQQFGGGGVFGRGEMRTLTISEKIQRQTEMVFYNPDGSSWIDLHQIHEEEDQHKTISFNLRDGIWVERRTYFWKREASAP